MTKNRFPPGWDEKRVRDIIEHYDAQTDEEVAAEIEMVSEGHTMVEVPIELVPLVTSLIARYEQGTPLEVLKESIYPKPTLVERNDPA
jgi:hypothetical protein